MIKAAINRILEIGAPSINEIEGRTYSDKGLILIDEPIYNRACINTHTLCSIVDFIKENPDKLNKVEPFIIHVVDHKKVELFKVADRKGDREHLISASADTPRFDFGNNYDRETFNIKLQSVFIRDENTEALLKVIGNMKVDEGVEVKDDGCTQSVVTKTGAVSLAKVDIPNPLELRPYRTFLEVIQPESSFIFRFDERLNISLHEADGGKWKNNARENIVDYFNKQLETEIKENSVTVLY